MDSVLYRRLNKAWRLLVYGRYISLKARIVAVLKLTVFVRIGITVIRKGIGIF